jgi:hypothetical protein
MFTANISNFFLIFPSIHSISSDIQQSANCLALLTPGWTHYRTLILCMVLPYRTPLLFFYVLCDNCFKFRNSWMPWYTHIRCQGRQIIHYILKEALVELTMGSTMASPTFEGEQQGNLGCMWESHESVAEVPLGDGRQHSGT